MGSVHDDTLWYAQELARDKIIDRVADAIAKTMFASHELPLPPDLAEKYRNTARAAIAAYKNALSDRQREGE
jgi:hypothetical protein